MNRVYSKEVIRALARLRHAAMNQPALSKVDFDTLDNAGVFAAVDEQADSASAEELLAEGAAIAMVARSNPGVPADRALQVLHNTWHPGRAETAGQYARRVSGGEPHVHDGCGLDCNR